MTQGKSREVAERITHYLFLIHDDLITVRTLLVILIIITIGIMISKAVF